MGFEGDLAPRPTGGEGLRANDSGQFKRFIAGLDTFDGANNEFQRTDTAPKETFGDGRLTAADQQQINNYIAGLDPPAAGGGPTEPVQARSLFESRQLPDKQAFGRSYRIISTSAGVGDEVMVTIELHADGSETGMSFTLGFDPSKLDFAGVSGTNNDPDVADGPDSPVDMNRTLNASGAHAGRIGILLDSSSGFVAGSSRILNLWFRVRTDAEGGVTPITFNDDSILRSTTNALAESVEAEWQPGEIAIKRPRSRDDISWLHTAAAEPPFRTCEFRGLTRTTYPN